MKTRSASSSLPVLRPESDTLTGPHARIALINLCSTISDIAALHAELIGVRDKYIRMLLSGGVPVLDLARATDLTRQRIHAIGRSNVNSG